MAQHHRLYNNGPLLTPTRGDGFFNAHPPEMRRSLLQILIGLAAAVEAAPWSISWSYSLALPPAIKLSASCSPGLSWFPTVTGSNKTRTKLTDDSTAASTSPTANASLLEALTFLPSKCPTAITNAITSVVSLTLTSAVSSTVWAENACATVSSLIATQTAAVPTVPAEVAWACMQSVPLNTTSGLILVENIKPYIQWQTTISYLKHPPVAYAKSAVDIWAVLASIELKLANGSYANEYAFEWDLYQLFQCAHDGHFRYLPTLVAGIIHFTRPVPLVSVSIDGKALPKPYVYTDILLQACKPNAFTASPIIQIDGQDAILYLENLSTHGSLQDLDALYNNVFYELAQTSLDSSGTGAGSFAGGRGAYFYAGHNTTLTFANGSSLTLDNFAQVYVNFNNVTTGQHVYDKYLDPPITNSVSVETNNVLSLAVSATTITATTTTSATATTVTTPVPGYPDPVIRQVNDLIRGYYLNETAYKDTAVLVIPTFVGDPAQEVSFQAVADEFLATAHAAGKKKLIIDVSANSGGTVLQGYSMFKSLFPSLDPYGATRFRAHEAFDLIGQEVSSYAGSSYPWDLLAINNSALNDFVESPFDYRSDMTQQGVPFDSWAQKFGPHVFNGDNFTSVIRWNLSDPYSFAGSGIIVNGYQGRSAHPPRQYFEAENIIMVSDGYCASTCAIFSELMTQQGGVRTVAMGGRPHAGPMQAVGGVKGVNCEFGYSLCGD